MGLIRAWQLHYYQPCSYHCNGAGSTWGFQAPVEVSVCLETQASDEVLLFLRNRSGTDGKTLATSKPAAGSWSAPVPVVALSRWCSPSLVLAPAPCCLRITPSLCNFCFTFLSTAAKCTGKAWFAPGCPGAVPCAAKGCRVPSLLLEAPFCQEETPFCLHLTPG